jgi:Ion channel
MDFTFKNRVLLRFIFISVLSYALLILVFAYLYYITNSIGFTPNSRSFESAVDFKKTIYFSIVTFHTIGFGDIHPITDPGRLIVMIQSTVSLFFTAVFSGFLVYFVIKRPNDLFSTKKLYIRHRNDAYWLSIRLGNKGRTIIDMKSRFEAWTIVDNSRVRAFQLQREVPDLERILYYDINLDDPKHHKLKEILNKAISKGLLLHMKFSFIGNDIRTGEQVAFAKYYDSSDLRFGKTFLNVYSWDANGHRKDFVWKNFERIEEMDASLQEQFRNA